VSVLTYSRPHPFSKQGRDTRKIENEFLVTVVPIMDHTGPLATSFPVENRLTGQTTDELRACLTAAKAKPYAQRLADFHLLLFLSQRLGESDVPLLCDAVATGGEVAEGYRLLIDSLAGM
jgi:nuclear protein localization family protein 4